MAKLKSLSRGEARFEVGRTYWELYLHEGKAEWWEWQIISINRVSRPQERLGNDRKLHPCYWANFVRKIKDVTWVKRSNSHGDWGWSKNIPNWCKQRVLIHDSLRTESEYERYQLPFGVYSTKVQAACFQIREAEMAVIECMTEAKNAISADKADWLSDASMARMDVAAAKRIVNRLSSGKAE